MKKILILEDEPVLAKIYAKNLRQAGFEVKTAQDVFSAIEKLNSFRPDLTFIDHGIKGKEESGLDFIPKLKEIHPNSKVIMLSNYSHASLRQECLKAGAEDFLVKLDVSPKLLPDYVKKLFSQHP